MRNFVSYAIDALNKKTIPLLKKINYNEDAISVLTFCDQLKESVHFSMPDGGRILDDKLKGLVQQELRLPFPMITIEYHQDAEKEFKKGQVASRDRILLAIEEEKDGDVWIYVLCAYRGTFDWEISPLGAAIPSKWDQQDSRGGFMPLKVLPDFLNNDANVEMIEIIKEEVAEECLVLLEFIEALTCRNVSHAPMGKVSKVMNDMRTRKGKTPFYETRELIINSKTSSGKVSDVVSIPGEYTPKRQHLRRGHIRRLEKGNVWVNSCIVGSVELGVINKTYKIAA